LSVQEAEKLNGFAPGLERHEVFGEVYYTIRDCCNQCYFIVSDGRCLIQNIKPLDDLCYPIKAIYDEVGGIIFVVDTFCPAHDKLTPEFIAEAKNVALKSIQRFSRATYEHWLQRHIGWITKTAKMI